MSDSYGVNLGYFAYIVALIAVFLWRKKHKVAGNIAFVVSLFLLILAHVLHTRLIKTWNVKSLLVIITYLALWYFMWKNEYRYNLRFLENILDSFFASLIVLLVTVGIMMKVEFLVAKKCEENHIKTQITFLESAADYYKVHDLISVEGVTVYINYIDREKRPFLETITKEKCSGCNTSEFFRHSVEEPYHFISESDTKITYKLYVHKDSIERFFLM